MGVKVKFPINSYIKKKHSSEANDLSGHLTKQHDQINRCHDHAVSETTVIGIVSGERWETLPKVPH